MNTPIVDFVKKYNDNNTVRAHMPGHKGESILGIEHLDITEIKGADSLFECDSIIKESEKNAGSLFNAHTFYSTEGSSLCIRAMLYLAYLYAKKEGKAPLVLAGRNAHKTFLSGVALLDMDVEWLYPENTTHLSLDISAEELDKKLIDMSTKPCALYLTSPDYLGNTLDIKAISKVCKKHSVLLLVDNAHGAYLRFLEKSQHPIDLGADICCDSAHKTLPVLTGGAYLHISKDADGLFSEKAKTALSIFASTSPSYLIMQSLDMANLYMADGYREKLGEFIEKVDALIRELMENGYSIVGNEPLKVTVNAKSYGYKGTELGEILREHNIECEFADPDFLVLMLTPSLKDTELVKIKDTLLSIEKREIIEATPLPLYIPERVMSVRDAVLSLSKTVKVQDSVGKVVANATVSCPPAVPVVVSGERIDENALSLFEYYNIAECEIVDE